jgi:hypothetical protein
MNDVGPLRKLPGLEGLHMVGQWTTTFTGTVIPDSFLLMIIYKAHP